MARTVTTGIFLDKSHPKADGKCAVSIRVTYNRTKRFYGTKYKLTINEFENLYSPKAKTKEKIILASLISQEEKAIEIIESLKDRFTFSLFVKKYMRNTGDQENIFLLLEERAKDLRMEGRISTAVTFECSLKSIKKFHDKQKLSLSEVDQQFLTRYNNWMEGLGNSPTTTGIYLRNVRTIFNEAISDGSISQEIYPFGIGRTKFKIPTGKNIKKALTHYDVGKIYQYKPETENLAMAVDFWILSYLANGINVKDIALLKIKNIDGDVIRFERAKTKRANIDKPITITIVITERIRRIIKKWGNKSINPDEYLFPILRNNLTPEEEYKIIQLFVAFINNNIKKVALKLNISGSVTTYVARHSFSTVLRNDGKSIEFISESLGHKDLKTTQNYLASFEDTQRKKNVLGLTNFPKLKVV